MPGFFVDKAEKIATGDKINKTVMLLSLRGDGRMGGRKRRKKVGGRNPARSRQKTVHCSAKIETELTSSKRGMAHNRTINVVSCSKERV